MSRSRMRGIIGIALLDNGETLNVGPPDQVDLDWEQRRMHFIWDLKPYPGARGSVVGFYTGTLYRDVIPPVALTGGDIAFDQWVVLDIDPIQPTEPYDPG